MIGFLIGLVVVGLIAGAIARLLVPGDQELSIPATIGVGIAGSFVGGFLSNLLFDVDASLQPAGILGSVVGAVIVLLVWTRVAGGQGARS